MKFGVMAFVGSSGSQLSLRQMAFQLLGSCAFVMLLNQCAGCSLLVIQILVYFAWTLPPFVGRVIARPSVSIQLRKVLTVKHPSLMSSNQTSS